MVAADAQSQIMLRQCGVGDKVVRLSTDAPLAPLADRMILNHDLAVLLVKWSVLRSWDVWALRLWC